MNKRTGVMAMAIIFCLTLLTTTSYGQDNNEGGFSPQDQKRSGFDKEKMSEKMVEQLDLTEEQKGLIKQHQASHREKMKSLMETLKEKKTRLRQELEKTDINKKRLTTLVNEIKPLLGRQLDMRVEGILAMKEILTPEQFQKFQELIKQRPKRGMRGGKRSSMGPCQDGNAGL